MFIWPCVVFEEYLQKKDKIFRFSFCVIVQIIISNTIVLILGLFHLLDLRLVSCLLYGVFLIAFLKGGAVKKIFAFFKRWQTGLQKLKSFHSSFWEYILLFIIVAFGIMYFSYGPLHEYSYGHFDMRLHHEWINGLIEGNIFSGGIYPEAMHSFIYCLYALFGIRVHSIVLFLQCIHIMVFILSAYSLMRECFGWRYTPLLVLTLYLTMDFVYPYCMVRLQSTIPLEFGLHTQFLCTLFFVRYLKNAKSIVRKERSSKFYWNENLLLFMLALAASIATHFYIPIMTFVLCFCFAVFNIKKIVSQKYLVPLLISVLCGCVIAATPMIGAAASGKSFEGSIYWGLNSMDNGSNGDKLQGEEVQEKKIVQGPLDLSEKDFMVIEKFPAPGRKAIEKIIEIELFVKAVYRRGYQGMYWQKRGGRIFAVTLAMIFLCLIGRQKKHEQIRKITCKYYPIILASVLDMIIFMAYEAPDLGLKVIIADHRICSTEHMLVLMVMMMPVDFIFMRAVNFCTNNTLQAISRFSIAAIYLFVRISGIFHSYLYYAWVQYNSVISVSNSIVDEFPEGSFTVVSQWEDSCDVSLYGEFEHIADFVKRCDSEYYSLPTQYVFLYIEKRPIVEYQQYYFSGPSWLAKSGSSKIKAFEISKEAAKEEIPKTINDVNRYRIIVESKAYEWCQSFLKECPSRMRVYYEDEDFVCYCFDQDQNAPYNLSLFEY